LKTPDGKNLKYHHGPTMDMSITRELLTNTIAAQKHLKWIMISEKELETIFTQA